MSHVVVNKRVYIVLFVYTDIEEKSASIMSLNTINYDNEH